jgi:hypothetical protein
MLPDSIAWRRPVPRGMQVYFRVSITAVSHIIRDQPPSFQFRAGAQVTGRTVGLAAVLLFDCEERESSDAHSRGC